MATQNNIEKKIYIYPDVSQTTFSYSENHTLTFSDVQDNRVVVYVDGSGVGEISNYRGRVYYFGSSEPLNFLLNNYYTVINGKLVQKVGTQ